MSTGTSYLVWAERFQLMELKSASNGTYNKEGRKESTGSKLVVRSWAEGRNINDNNELYVFDEEETDRLDEQRQANKLAQSSIKTESAEDKIANAIAKAMANIGAVKDASAKVEEEESFEYGSKTIIVKEGMMEELKTVIKDEDLGIRVGKNDSYATVYMKVELARKDK